MSRINAAARVLRNCFWSHKEINVFTRPIYLRDTGEIIGYFDRISMKLGQVRLDGWVNAESLTVLTDSSSATICPDIERADVTCAGPTPGFSLTVRGIRTLKYRVGPDQRFSDIKIWGLLSALETTVSYLLFLALIAARYHRDIWSYLLQGDVLAGDRLENAMQATPLSRHQPTATIGLFGRRDQPEVVEPVDIIVPVFNAHNELRHCLNCLATHTDGRHRITLVDDASTDPRIRPVLEKWAAQRDNVCILINSKNKGFVKSVNIALAQSSGHVVLLNSDAFVGAQWLERLMAPMLSDNRVASVTPLSNKAEILSIPFSLRNNKASHVQSGVIDKALQNLDWQTACCEVPTGIGFCMLMSRDWIDQVPMLDHIYGRGYGEEVDWCLKVARLGAIHIGHGGLFVEHKGASSFTTTSAHSKAKNQQIIFHRFPSFDLSVQEFRQKDPLIGSRLVATLALIDEGEPVSVYLAHDSGGGAELWLKEQILSKASTGRACVVVRGWLKAGEVNIEIHVGGHKEAGLIPREDLAQYLMVLGQINLVYSCLALTSKPLELIQLCLKKLRPTDMVSVLFHDFFPVCPSHNLIGHDGVFCGLPNAERCNACYEKMATKNVEWPARIDDWRREWLHLLQRANRIVTFSNSTCDHVLQVWPHLRPKLTLEPHRMTWLPPSISQPLSDRIVVGVLGSIGYQKGAAVIRDLAECSDGAFDIVTIGQFDPSFASSGIKVHGNYNRNDVEALAKRYAVSCWIVPSIWPETFCYAAREALATGLPVIGFDLGAQGEAIQNAQNGIVLPAGSDIHKVRAAILALSPKNKPLFVPEFPNSKLALSRFSTPMN